MANLSLIAQRLKAEFIPTLSPEGSANLLIEKGVDIPMELLFR